MRYVIRFDFDGKVEAWAAEEKNGLCFTVNQSNATVFEDEKLAERILVNGYGGLAKYGSVEVAADVR